MNAKSIPLTSSRKLEFLPAPVKSGPAGLLIVLIAVAMASPLLAGPSPYYVAGDFNGWNAAGTLMSETSPGSGVWQAALSVSGRHEFKITGGDWSWNFPAANSWFDAGTNGSVTIMYDSNVYSDGWSNSSGRIGEDVDLGAWTAVGDWQGWDTANPATAMVSMGGGIYMYQRSLLPGTYAYQAVRTGTWDAIGKDARSVAAAALGFTTTFANPQAVFWVNALNGTIKVDTQSEPVATPPSISAQPQSQIMMPPYASNTTFTVVASGAAPLGYQWRFNGTNLADDAHVGGATANSLTIFNVKTNDEGSYSVVVTNAGGSVTSSVAILIWSPPPVFDPTTQTAGGVILIGIAFGGGLGSLAYLQVHISPPEAVLAGAGWRLQGSDTNFHSDPNYTETVSQVGTPVVECRAVAGWDGPTNRNVSVTLGELTVMEAAYTRSAQLAVSPATGFSASGYAGGPFTPDSIGYSLANSGDATLEWWAAQTPDWLTLSAARGTLAVGQNTNLSVHINANISGLAPGTYSGALAFANLNNTVGNAVYPVNLLVSNPPPLQLAGMSLLTNGALPMTLQGVPGRVYAVLASSNLLTPRTNWTELLRLTNTTGQITFTNPPPAVTPQYYRAKEL